MRSIDMEDLIPTIQDKQARKRLQKRLAEGSPAQRAGARFSQARRGRRPVADHQGQPAADLSLARAGSRGVFRRRPDGFRQLPRNHAGRPPAAPGPLRARDIAIKVVGVGSVGTWCGIVLLLASEKDPLFLQVKEARPSVLEAYAGKSVYPNHGQRVVNGCRLMQSASDLFLGWTVGPAAGTSTSASSRT